LLSNVLYDADGVGGPIVVARQARNVVIAEIMAVPMGAVAANKLVAIMSP